MTTTHEEEQASLLTEDVHHGHSHSHGHGHAHDEHEHTGMFHFEKLKRLFNKQWSFKIIGTLTLLYCIAELVVAVILGSLTLLSDGFHNLGDVLAIYIAHYASELAKKKITEDDHMTYGWRRTEVLGGLVNAIFLVSLSLYIVLEAIPRFVKPPQIDAGIPFIAIAVLGLVINTVGTVVFAMSGLHHAHGHSHSHGHSHGHIHSKEAKAKKPHKKHKDLNVWGVFIHYVGDMVSSLFVLISGIIINAYPDKKWVRYIDPLSSMFIVVLILYTTLPLVKQCLTILIQKAPHDLDLKACREKLLTLEGVLGVHDFHAWELVDGMTITTLHLTCSESVVDVEILKGVHEILHEFHLHSSSIQIERVPGEKAPNYCKEHCAKNCEDEWCCVFKKIQEERAKKYNTNTDV